MSTLVTTDYKDPPTVTEYQYYVVRRLTPTECASLQGFPKWWCSGLETECPTDEEITFWEKVFDTYDQVVGGRKKPRSKTQIVNWLKAPHSDAAEYKLWGNGVALPCVHFVMEGIVWANSIDEQEGSCNTKAGKAE